MLMRRLAYVPNGRGRILTFLSVLSRVDVAALTAMKPALVCDSVEYTTCFDLINNRTFDTTSMRVWGNVCVCVAAGHNQDGSRKHAETSASFTPSGEEWWWTVKHGGMDYFFLFFFLLLCILQEFVNKLKKKKDKDLQISLPAVMKLLYILTAHSSAGLLTPT